MDEKVYQPEIVQEVPFPGEPQLISLPSQSNPAGTFTPNITKENIFPIKRTSVELLSTALNTRSRKILEEFELQQSGGLKIGEFKEGISGDLRITPNGMTARNRSGITTFAIDGDSGDAVFKGVVQAADFVIADENGLVSASNFQSDTVSASNEITESSGFAEKDLDNMSLSLTLVRPAKVLITFTVNVRMGAIDSFRTYFVDVKVNIDGTNQAGVPRFELTGVSLVELGTCLSFARTFLISGGEHVIKLRWIGSSDTSVYANSRNLSYCMLGS